MFMGKCDKPTVKRKWQTVCVCTHAWDVWWQVPVAFALGVHATSLDLNSVYTSAITTFFCNPGSLSHVAQNGALMSTVNSKLKHITHYTHGNVMHMLTSTKFTQHLHHRHYYSSCHFISYQIPDSQRQHFRQTLRRITQIPSVSGNQLTK